MREVAARSKELKGVLCGLDVSKWVMKESMTDEMQRTGDTLGRTQSTLDWFLRCEDDLKRKWSAQGLPFDFKILKEIQHGGWYLCMGMCMYVELVYVNGVRRAFCLTSRS